ncbi:LPXTG cell wall anchor domain-containing protein [Streptomyces sp. NPDC048290]|uniref:LPXTG cell wall anchor domain-containing protein n=1 Tax=Streptomyces sp. NPDC048290 TaxID=3155811 RepID=UPI0034261936
MPPADRPTGPAAEGSLAHTGTDSTSWLLAASGLLVTAGGGALIAARRRKSRAGEDSPATS